MIKILIADDHPVVLKGIKDIISETHDITVADEAGDGLEAVKKVRKNDYDVVLLDISMPGVDGLEALGEMQKMKPDLPVLILSIYPEEQFAVRAIKTGASGYLTKQRAPDELVTAIRRVYRGGKYIGAVLAEKMASDLARGDERPPHEKLSDREYEVMRMIVKGKSTKEMAEALFLSPKTISTYRSRVFQKMNIKSDVELARYAFEHKLIE